MKLHYTLPLLAAMLLGGCSLPLTGDSTTGVEIGGVNYSDQPLFYVVSDPNGDGGGAEPLDPFSAGGTMCCFSLPEKWRPGIKVLVNIRDGYNEPIKEALIDVPPYVDGKPGMLWAAYYQDGSIEVVSSNYGPPHEKWPGRIKGWPVPTLEYRRELWKLHMDLKKGTLRSAQKLLKELKDDPDKRLRASWTHNQQYNPKEIEPFNGPGDPAYKQFLMHDYEQFLIDAQRDVDEWMKAKP